MRRALTVLLLALLATGLTAAPPAQARQTDGAEAALTGAVQISASGAHSCARMGNGTARCWGTNYDGEAGRGVINQPVVPVQTVLNATGSGPLTGITQIDTGTYHTCALLASTQVRCWGYNGDGQVGNGSVTTQIARPKVVALPNGQPLTGVRQLALGERHSCALLLNGQVRCWGQNVRGELGDGTPPGTDRRRPRVVLTAGGAPFSGAVQIDAGQSTTCATLANGQARCWGYNTDGQLGTGSAADEYHPTPVRNANGTLLQHVTQVAAGALSTCARVEGGQARCWGRGEFGALGTGNTNSSLAAQAVRSVGGGQNLTGVSAVDVGTLFACARLANGQARCWGNGIYGQLGWDALSGNSLPRIVGPVSGALTGVRQLRTGANHACTVQVSGQARCWGFNDNGQVGDNSTTTRKAPAVVQLP